jgi:hypothetical protein
LLDQLSEGCSSSCLPSPSLAKNNDVKEEENKDKNKDKYKYKYKYKDKDKDKD